MASMHRKVLHIIGDLIGFGCDELVLYGIILLAKQLLGPRKSPRHGGGPVDQSAPQPSLSPEPDISVDIPGLLEACRGYDTPSGNPHPGRGSTDPGLRKQIFRPMVRDHDGHYAVDGTFITGNEQVRP